MKTPLVNASSLTEFLSDIGGDQSFFADLTREFEKQLMQFESVGFSGDAQNVKQLAEQAHKLKVSCQTFGAERMVGLFTDLERIASASPASEVGTLFTEICNVRPETLKTIEEVSTDFLKTWGKSA